MVLNTYEIRIAAAGTSKYLLFIARVATCRYSYECDLRQVVLLRLHVSLFKTRTMTVKLR